MKKTEKIQLIYVLTYVSLLLIGLVLLFIFPGLVSVLCFIGVLVLGYIGMGIVRSKCNTYTCPHCEHRFSISAFRDLFSRSGGRLGKKLKCPNCGNVNYMPEEAK